MFSKSKLEGVGFLDSILSLVDKFKYWIIPLGASIMSTVSASFTNGIEYFAPLSYVLVAFIGLLLGMAGLALFGLYQERMSKVKYLELINSKPHTVNPLEDTFRNQVIDIRDFADIPSMIHENKTFINCVIKGPAVVFFQGQTGMDPVMFSDCDLVGICSTNNRRPNAVIFTNASFRKCRLYNLTILIPDELIATDKSSALYQQVISGQINKITK